MDLTQNRTKIWILLIILAWVIPGLIGHQPWKPDEAYTTGLVYHIHETGDWVVPTLAGEPFMEKPPIFFITASIFGKLFSNILPFHDAIRLASGFFSLLTMLFVGLTARAVFGKNRGWIAALLFIGCLGILSFSHFLITDVSLLTGFAIALYGGCLIQRSSFLGGLFLGTGVGLGLLSKGLLCPGICGITFAMLPIFSRIFRNKRYFAGLLWSIVFFSPWALIWPIALYKNSPALFHTWFWTNNFGRYLTGNMGPKNETLLYFNTLPWYAFPAWILASLTLWNKRKSLLKSHTLQILCTFFLVTIFILTYSSNRRQLYGMPIVLPLVILGSEYIFSKSNIRWLSHYFLNLCKIGFTIAGIGIWLGWLILHTTKSGFLFKIMSRIEDAYTPSINYTIIFAALLISACWIVLLRKIKKSNTEAIIMWGGGLALAWSLVMTLWLPVIDSGKRYDHMIEDLTLNMPKNHGTFYSFRLGEPQRALLHYQKDIKTKRIACLIQKEFANNLSDSYNGNNHPFNDKTQKEIICYFTKPTANYIQKHDLLLVQGFVNSPYSNLNEILDKTYWKKIWEGARKDDRRERYWLFQKIK